MSNDEIVTIHLGNTNQENLEGLEFVETMEAEHLGMVLQYGEVSKSGTIILNQKLPIRSRIKWNRDLLPSSVVSNYGEWSRLSKKLAAEIQDMEKEDMRAIRRRLWYLRKVLRRYRLIDDQSGPRILKKDTRNSNELKKKIYLNYTNNVNFRPK